MRYDCADRTAFFWEGVWFGTGAGGAVAGAGGAVTGAGAVVAATVVGGVVVAGAAVVVGTLLVVPAVAGEMEFVAAGVETCDDATFS